MKKDKAFFDRLYRTYNKRGLISPDPLEFLYRWQDPADREIAALLGACFAYGNVKAILKNLNYIFARVEKPHAYISRATKAKLHQDFKGFKYRFTTEEELVSFLLSIQKILKKYGSLQACFLSAMTGKEENILPGLKHLAHCLRDGGNVSSLVPDPDKNSAMKRMNLFLRWMIRRDEVDPGGWAVPAQLLIVPLDVHMHRCARALGLTQRNSADMQTALDITHALRRFCPEDPVKYDFCITRFGIRSDMDEQDLCLALTPKRHSGKTPIFQKNQRNK